MKKPKIPPKFEVSSAEKLFDILDRVPSPLVEGKYLHWDEVRYRPCPEGLSDKEWWFGIKTRRQSLYKSLPIIDRQGKPFQYAMVDPIPECLHHIDRGASGMIEGYDSALNADNRDRYFIHSLMEESITSSQLEGASTTRKVAKDMLRSGRKPRDKSEKMIVNNFNTMRRILELKDRPLKPEIVHEIHRMVSQGTLDDPDAEGRLRNTDENIAVYNQYNEILHEPPHAKELPERMRQMCDFANAITPAEFIHPVLRAIMLHFWLAYDHPYVDGNGRTARALFYWSMLRNGFWLFEFVSISHIINKSPVRYGMSYLYTETDDNDLTYFLLFNLDVIRKSIESLHRYIDRKSQQIHTLENELRGMRGLNYRQQALISHALRHPNHVYDIESHRKSHNVVYQTARSDLLEMESAGLLRSHRRGKKIFFTPVENLEAKLHLEVEIEKL